MRIDAVAAVKQGDYFVLDMISQVREFSTLHLILDEDTSSILEYLVVEISQDERQWVRGLSNSIDEADHDDVISDTTPRRLLVYPEHEYRRPYGMFSFDPADMVALHPAVRSNRRSQAVEGL